MKSRIQKKLHLGLRILVLGIAGPQYEKHHPLVRAKIGKRSIRTYFTDKELDEIESEHKEEIKFLKNKYNKINWVI